MENQIENISGAEVQTEAAAPKKKFCVKCGNELQDDLAFCTSCGAPKMEAPQKKFCVKCGNELSPGHKFCQKCGQPTDVTVPTGAMPPVNRGAYGVKKDNTPKIIAAAVGGVLVIAILLVVLLGGKSNFKRMYKDISGMSWCYIYSDGKTMEIDTNPYNRDDEFISAAYLKIQGINNDLGFAPSVFDRMGETRAIDGRQYASNDKYSISWTYHPDEGLEVTYRINK